MAWVWGKRNKYENLMEKLFRKGGFIILRHRQKLRGKCLRQTLCRTGRFEAVYFYIDFNWKPDILILSLFAFGRFSVEYWMIFLTCSIFALRQIFTCASKEYLSYESDPCCPNSKFPALYCLPSDHVLQPKQPWQLRVKSLITYISWKTEHNSSYKFFTLGA
jgi:hypothetical protein